MSSSAQQPGNVPVVAWTRPSLREDSIVTRTAISTLGAQARLRPVFDHGEAASPCLTADRISRERESAYVTGCLRNTIEISSLISPDQCDVDGLGEIGLSKRHDRWNCAAAVLVSLRSSPATVVRVSSASSSSCQQTGDVTTWDQEIPRKLAGSRALIGTETTSHQSDEV